MPSFPSGPPSDMFIKTTFDGPGVTAITQDDQPVNWSPIPLAYPANMWRLQELAASATVTVDTPFCIRCDCTASAITVTLPPTLTNSLKMAHIMKTDAGANAVTVAIDASDTWYGAVAAQTLATQYKSVTLLAVNNSNVSGWHVIATT